MINISQKTIACGVWKLVESGILQYVAEHGRKPAALILHPQQQAELMREMGLKSALLDGISILNSPRFEMPILADSYGNFVEL
ncbi:conserved hypothetical protein [Paraburkholderia sacchari]|uniref:hypothetical protein n=1 Tax=Paraburkholderia sacchari TaxID=159450 RepID=UPI0039A6C5F8